MKSAVAIPIGTNRTLYNEGPRALPDELDFTSVTSLSREIDLESTGISQVKSVFVDNSSNAQEVVLAVNPSGQKIAVPPLSQAFFPIVQVGPTFSFNGTSTGAVSVGVLYLNVEKTYSVWSTVKPGTINGAVTVSGTIDANVTNTALPVVNEVGTHVSVTVDNATPVQVDIANATPVQVDIANTAAILVTEGAHTITDGSGTITLGGTSQQLFAANPNRVYLFVQNPSNATESLFINFGATAASATTQEIKAGEYFQFPGPVSSDAVQIFAATTGHKFVAHQM